jgi:hypothetical protein
LAELHPVHVSRIDFLDPGATGAVTVTETSTLEECCIVGSLTSAAVLGDHVCGGEASPGLPRTRRCSSE